MRPWDASRPARLSALAAPLVRSTSTAFSRSPAVSSRAFLQSIMPAPVRARSSATSLAGMSFTVVTLLTPHENAALAPWGSEGGGRLVQPDERRPARLAFARAARFRGRRGRRLIRLEPRRDRFRLGAALAPRRLLLLVSLRLAFDAGFGRVRHALAFLGGLAQRHLVPRFRDHVRDGRSDEGDGPDRVVVARDGHRDQLRVRVRVHDRDHGDAELVRLGDGDPLLFRVHDNQRPWQPAHILDAREILLELGPLAVEQQLLLLRVVLELALGRTLLQLFQTLDLFLDRLEVRERPAQPPLGDIERPAALRLRLQDVLELLLGAHEQHAFALEHHPAEQFLRGLDLPQRLLEVDDVNPRPLGEDEPAHLGIPAARLMAEMDARFQQILQLRLRHALPLVGFEPPLLSFSVPPRLRGPSTESSRVSDYLNCLVRSARLSPVQRRRRGPRVITGSDRAPRTAHRLLNWNRFRAPARPGFLRSTARRSRVSRPCSRSFVRCRSSARHRALATASRNAPACPVTPPPRHSARTSKAPSVSVAVNGCWMCDTSDGRGK